MIRLTCKEVEDENEDEDDWGSRGRELRPTIANIVCLNDGPGERWEAGVRHVAEPKVEA